MGLKLDLISLWMPEFILKKELEHIGQVTIRELDQLIQDNIPLYSESFNMPALKGNSNEIRKIIALEHNKRVELLIDSLGRDKAITLGRGALFKVGKDLGSELKNRLGVGESLKELIKAARILYRVLGIDFEVLMEEKSTMVVKRCTLAQFYTPTTCQVLSAADEGVIQGLNPEIKLKFTKRMTDGNTCCLASIQVKGV